MRLAAFAVILATATLTGHYATHRRSLEDCRMEGPDTLMSLDSARVVRQLVGSPIRTILWQVSIVGLEGAAFSFGVPADTPATVWVYQRASKSGWDCGAQVGVGSFSAGVPPGFARPESIVVDASGRRVQQPLPWGVKAWRVPKKGGRR